MEDSRCPPFRVVVDAIRRVGDHQDRLDTFEQALDLVNEGRIPAEQAMPPKDP